MTKVTTCATNLVSYDKSRWNYDKSIVTYDKSGVCDRSSLNTRDINSNPNREDVGY